MTAVDWKGFWTSYRKKEAANDEDLYFEVGKTVNKQPLSAAPFQLSIDLIVEGLALKGDDRLLELCCGNGLVTRELAPLVREIRAADFAEHLITHARKFSAARNVSYFCADAISYLERLLGAKDYIPAKVLLGDALCYFEPADLAKMLALSATLTSNSFMFMASGIPCDELKWNFYNTPDRVRRYEENQLLPANTNDGIGRWWKREELERAGRECGLHVSLKEQPAELSDFRVNVTYSS